MNLFASVNSDSQHLFSLKWETLYTEYKVLALADFILFYFVDKAVNFRLDPNVLVKLTPLLQDNEGISNSTPYITKHPVTDHIHRCHFRGRS